MDTADINEMLSKEPLLRSKIKHQCSHNRVFSSNYKQEIINNCMPNGGTAVWQYNTTNRLPDCIRKIFKSNY